MPLPKSILVVSLRYFGDVLLTTPLIRALARGYEGAAIDVCSPREPARCSKAIRTSGAS